MENTSGINTSGINTSGINTSGINISGIVALLNKDNIDTDQIIPKQFLKSIQRTGFGQFLFDTWRYTDEGYLGQDCSKRELNPKFSLNQARYKNAHILLTGNNFGCGSSREHAPWALKEYGFKCIISASFADIFYNNCFKNNLLPIQLSASIIDRLMREVEENIDYKLEINLKNQKILTPTGEIINFAIDEFRKQCFIKGLDDIAVTLVHTSEIRNYEKRHKDSQPWLFN